MQENKTDDNKLLIKNKDQKETLDNNKAKENILPIINTFSSNEDDKEKLKQIQLLQEKIDNEKSIINEFDSQLDQLKTNENKQIKKNTKSVAEIESIKKKNNLISKLKSKNHSLYNSLSDLNEKQKELEVGTSLNIQEKNANKDKLKNIKIEKEIIQNKIKEIDNQIKIIIEKEKMIPQSKIKLKKNYISNIEEKNYINNKLPISQIKTSPSSFLNTIEELEKKEEEEKEAKKLEKYQNLRNKELEVIRRRKKKIDTLTKARTPKYVQKKNYTTAEEKEKIRLMKEEALIQQEKKKRKMRLQPISSEELNKFSREVKRNERIFKEELGMKKIQMKELWQERKNLLPEYKSKFFEFNKQNEDKMKEELILKKERIKQDVRERIKFGEDIIKNLQPQLNDKLKSEREENIKKLKGVNKQQEIKELGNKLKKISNKIALSQPKNFKLSKKFVISEADGGKNNIKKLVPLEKYKDYLTEERLKNEMKSLLTPTTSSYDNKVNKWENMLINDKDVYNNIEQIKMEAELLQNKADTKRQLLKHEKGTNNLQLVDNLNNEISNLYIGSIQAKLQILKKIAK